MNTKLIVILLQMLIFVRIQSKQTKIGLTKQDNGLADLTKSKINQVINREIDEIKLHDIEIKSRLLKGGNSGSGNQVVISEEQQTVIIEINEFNSETLDVKPIVSSIQNVKFTTVIGDDNTQELDSLIAESAIRNGVARGIRSYQKSSETQEDVLNSDAIEFLSGLDESTLKSIQDKYQITIDPRIIKTEQINEYLKKEDEDMLKPYNPQRFEDLGYQNICKKEIMDSENLVAEYFATKFVESTSLFESRNYMTIKEPFTNHLKLIEGYSEKISKQMSLVDQVYYWYLPIRIKPLLNEFVVKFQFVIDNGIIISSSLKDYQVEWEREGLYPQDYQKLATLFYKEYQLQKATVVPNDEVNLNLIVSDYDFLSTKHTLKTLKFEQIFSKMKILDPEYKERLEKLNKAICVKLIEIVYLMCADTEHISAFQSRIGGINGNQDVEYRDRREIAQQFFISFYSTLTTDTPQDCKFEKNKENFMTYEEILFKARYNININDEEYKVFKTTFLGEKRVGRDFLNKIGCQTNPICRYHLFLFDFNSYVREESYNILLEYALTPIVFHADFFKTLSEFTIEIDHVSSQTKTITFEELRDHWTAKGATNDFTYLYDSYILALETIYRAYIYLIEKKEIIQTSSKVNIWTSLCKFLGTDIKIDNNDSLQYFNTVDLNLLKEKYAVIGDTTIRLASIAGVQECNFESAIKRIEPDLPNKPIKLHKNLIKFMITVQIQIRFTTYETYLTGLKWDLSKCESFKINQIGFEKLVGQKSVRVPNGRYDTPRSKAKKIEIKEVYRFNSKCFSVQITKIRTIIEKGLAIFTENPKTVNYVRIVYFKFMKYIRGIKEINIQRLLLHMTINWIKNYKDEPQTDDLKIFILYFIKDFEANLLRRLNYYKTAGFFGTVMRMFTITSEKNKGTGKDPISANFKQFIKRKRIDERILEFDLYYFANLAGKKTKKSSGIGEEQNKFDTNKENMLKQVPKFFAQFESDMYKKPNPLKLSKFELFKKNIVSCRPSIITSKDGIALDLFDLSPGRSTSDNPLITKDCDINFAIRWAEYLFTAEVFVEAMPLFNTDNYFHIYFYEQSARIAVPKVTMARMYQHLQTIRINYELDFEDPIYYMIYKTQNCIRVKTRENGQCAYSPKSYAIFYWLFSYILSINNPSKAISLDFFGDESPIYGTSQLILLTSYIKSFKEDFTEYCRHGALRLESWKICKLFDLQQFWETNVFKEMSKSINPIKIYEDFTTILDNNPGLSTPPNKIVLKLLFIESYETFIHYGREDSFSSERLKDIIDTNPFSSQVSEFRATVLQGNNPNRFNYLFSQDSAEDKKVINEYFFYTHVYLQSISVDDIFIRNSIIELIKKSDDKTNYIKNMATENNLPLLTVYKIIFSYAPDVDSMGTIMKYFHDTGNYYLIPSVQFDHSILEELKNCFPFSESTSRNVVSESLDTFYQCFEIRINEHEVIQTKDNEIKFEGENSISENDDDEFGQELEFEESGMNNNKNLINTNLKTSLKEQVTTIDVVETTDKSIETMELEFEVQSILKRETESPQFGGSRVARDLLAKKRNIPSNDDPNSFKVMTQEDKLNALGQSTNKFVNLEKKTLMTQMKSGSIGSSQRGIMIESKNDFRLMTRNNEFIAKNAKQFNLLGRSAFTIGQPNKLKNF